MLEEKVYLKEKIASLVVHIAKREWPQNWTGMVQTLCEIAARGVSFLSILHYTLISFQDTQVELVLLVFRSLAEDSRDGAAPLGDRRRRELLNALTQQSKDIFPFISGHLANSCKKINTPERNRAVLICNAALSALVPYMEFVPLEFVLSFIVFALLFFSLLFNLFINFAGLFFPTVFIFFFVRQQKVTS